jgi:hypothetical protein
MNLVRFFVPQYIYFTLILIRCSVRMLALEALQIPPRFNTCLIINGCTTFLVF